VSARLSALQSGDGVESDDLVVAEEEEELGDARQRTRALESSALLPIRLCAGLGSRGARQRNPDGAWDIIETASSVRVWAVVVVGDVRGVFSVGAAAAVPRVRRWNELLERFKRVCAACSYRRGALLVRGTRVPCVATVGDKSWRVEEVGRGRGVCVLTCRLL
jgi:hypothetical protein